MLAEVEKSRFADKDAKIALGPNFTWLVFWAFSALRILLTPFLPVRARGRPGLEKRGSQTTIILIFS